MYWVEDAPLDGASADEDLAEDVDPEPVADEGSAGEEVPSEEESPSEDVPDEQPDTSEGESDDGTMEE